MNSPELTEDIHQYPIRAISDIAAPKKNKDSQKIQATQNNEQNRDKKETILSNDITVIIPTINPQTDVMNNMRFIINKFLDLNLKVIVVEQNIDQYSYLFKFIESIMISRGITSKSLAFEFYISDEKKFLRDELIEWVLQHKVKTPYVWINDPNFYSNYSEILHKVNHFNDVKFICAYSSLKNVSRDETLNLIGGSGLALNSKKNTKKDFYYSTIINKKRFLQLKSGTGDKNISVLNNFKNKKLEVRNIDEAGFYLYNGPKTEILPKLKFSNNRFEKDMAIIVVHFNWCKYINPTRNLNRFLRQMEIEDVPVYGIELSLNDNFETKNRKNWINLKVGVQNVCFQKEACINLVEKSIPESYRKIAWIDPDLHFTNNNWYRETSEKLNTHKLVQMYSEGYGTDRYGRISRRHPSIMAMYGKVPMDYWFRHPGHPGGAWGAQREFWQNGGLYPYCIMGGGDTVFVYTIFDYTFANEVYSLLGICGDNIFAPYAEWKNKIKSYVGPNDITYVNNSFIHEWHGDSVNRNYNLRHNIAKTIDMTSNVRLNELGIIELYNIKKKSIYDGILGYFKGRDEDGIIGDMEAYINFRNQLNEQNK